MAIGSNDNSGEELDDFENDFEEESTLNKGQSALDNDDNSKATSDDTFIDDLLKQKGIQDKSKILFEDEDGTQRSVNWSDLSEEEKLNIIDTADEDPDVDLDDNEIELLNKIRESGLSPKEYIQYIQDDAVNSIKQQSINDTNKYQVDDYTDDELFVADYLSKIGDATQDEVQRALNNAKHDEDIYKKQIGALRSEYKQLEDENRRQAQMENQRQTQEQYNTFRRSIVDQINQLKDYSGYDLNLNQDDMQELYDFITGYDASGNNYFVKALQDPKTLTRVAYLALNGERMIQDITNYFQKEITNVRRESYKRGLADASGQINGTNVVFRNSGVRSRQNNNNDLDDLT